MYRFHDIFLPADIQQELLGNFEAIIRRPIDNPVYLNAQNIFRTLVTKASGSPCDRSAQDRFRGYAGNGKTLFSDIHYEIEEKTSAAAKLTKYVLIVANKDRVTPIFYSNYPPELLEYRAEDVFQLQEDALIVQPGLPFEFDWAQPKSGQLASFNMLDQAHSAAPLYEGDQKVFFEAFA
ncbi:MAG: hypothetical protein JWO47_547 [Candidatus Saccharibacteria bacterium]|nr:hypothetical protein [Candidatus Saccharibacteria bacterium]